MSDPLLTRRDIDPAGASEETVTLGDPAALAALSATMSDPDTDTPPAVAGYDLVRVIGRGGMGVVWEAIEHRLDRPVALKVNLGHVGDDALMWSEARAAARVSDPGIVAVHDLGTTLDGKPYYTMDLVQGTTLDALLREGPLPQARALTLGGQISRAVAAAHEGGVAHRDLKPGNILIDEHGRARVLDFGLATRLAGPDHFANEVFGTPTYMAPEQVRAQPVGPAADIHAIGLLLYEMLTGKRAFYGESTGELMASIATRVPEPPTTKNPDIHADVERVVMRCLEKDPEARFPSARKLAIALESILDGRPLEIANVPAFVRRTTLPVPPAPAQDRDRAPIHHRWAWTLRSSRQALWPLVANTERVNLAIGLPEIEVLDATDGEGASIRTARARVLGMEMAWREFPFDWIQNRTHRVFREYSKGPLLAMWNQVELTEKPDGTELVHEIWMTPRHLLGRMAAGWELSQKIGKNLDHLYRRLDAGLVKGGDLHAGADPFDPPFEPTFAQKTYAEDIGAQLVSQGFDAKLVDRLVGHLLYQPTKVLERLRPYVLADAWGVAPNQLLTLFLHASNHGLLDLTWDLICPRCLAPHESCSVLSDVERIGACVPCSRTYSRDLRESVELTFRPHSMLRDATPTTYCAGAPALRPHILVQQRLAPGEGRVVEIELPRGDYRLVASRVLPTFAFRASTAGFADEIDVAIGEAVVDARPSVVRGGPVRLRLVNESAHEQVVRLELAEGRPHCVTAAEVLTLPDFRDLFSSEMIAEGEHLTVSRMAFLFVGLADRADLLKRLGDVGAWTVLRKLDALLELQLRTHHGTSVPASLDTHIAVFNTSDAAVHAAISLARATRDLGEPVRAAVHDGQCIALRRAGRTEYFGTTVHRGRELLDEAPPFGVALSTAVAGERSVALLLGEANVTQEVAVATSGAYRGMRIVRLTTQ